MQRLPERRIPRRAEHGESLHSYLWKHHTRSRCRTSTVPSRTRSWAKKQTLFELCMNACSFASTRRRNLPASERVWKLPASTTSCERTATQSFRNSGLQKSTASVGQRSLERFLPSLTEEQYDASDTQCWPAQNRVPKSARVIAAPAHLGALTAAKPRIQAMIQDAVWAGLPPEQPLETRLAAVVETATSTYLSSIDDEDSEGGAGSRRSLAANKWRTAVTRRHKPDHFASLDHPGSPSQDEAGDDMDLSAKNTLLSKGAWQQVTRIEDLCLTHVSHKWLHHLDACAPSVLTPHDDITKVRKRLGNRLWVGGGQCRCCGSFLDPQLEHAETCSTAEATRGHYACVHCGLRHETCRPGHYYGTQRAHRFAIQVG